MHLHLRERTVPFTSVPLSFISLKEVADSRRKFSFSSCENLNGIYIDEGGYRISGAARNTVSLSVCSSQTASFDAPWIDMREVPPPQPVLCTSSPSFDKSYMQ